MARRTGDINISQNFHLGSGIPLRDTEIVDTLADLTDLAVIPMVERHPGMRTWVLEEDKAYHLLNNLTTWEPEGTGSGGGGGTPDDGSVTDAKLATDVKIGSIAALNTLFGVALTNIQGFITNLFNNKVDKTTTVNGHALTGNVTVTKANVGLGNVDNTSDINKPISTLQQAALDLKADITYVDGLVTGLWDNKGDLDASTNPNYPVGVNGDTYYITVAGKVGGASGKTVNIGDELRCKANNAGGTEASVGTNWFIVESNRDQATESVLGVAKIATQAIVENEASTNDIDIVTTKKFWLGLARFKAIIQTFAEWITFTKGIILSPFTNSTPAEGQVWIEGFKLKARLNGTTVTLLDSVGNLSELSNIQTGRQNIGFDYETAPVSITSNAATWDMLQSGVQKVIDTIDISNVAADFVLTMANAGITGIAKLIKSTTNAVTISFAGIYTNKDSETTITALILPAGAVGDEYFLTWYRFGLNIYWITRDGQIVQTLSSSTTDYPSVGLLKSELDLRFKQGGNSFGAAISFGTLDDTDVAFFRFGTANERILLQSTGVRLTGAITFRTTGGTQTMNVSNTGLAIIGNGTAAARLHILEGTTNDISREETETTGTNPVLRKRAQAVATTTDATLTTLVSIPTTTDSGITIRGIVEGRRTGGVAGTVGDVASYEIKAIYKNVAGTVSLVGGGVNAIGESQGAWDCQLNISTTNILIQVQGAPDNNIRWQIVEFKTSEITS